MSQTCTSTSTSSSRLARAERCTEKYVFRRYGHVESEAPSNARAALRSDCASWRAVPC